MKVLYSRLASGRKREYQVVTKIVLENGEKYVQKKAACIEALDHIENTYHNESLMAPIYGDCLERGQWEGGYLITPFVTGESMGSRLRKCIEMQDEDEAAALLRKWRELIVGNQNNICEFVPSEGFESIFGNAADLAGVEATSISNFDCSAENILFTPDNRIKIIDYEWVFPISIPIEMTFYRVLKMFFAYNQGLIEWKTLLEWAEIKDRYLQNYEQMIDAFAEYVYEDKEKNINYALMGKKFKEGRVLQKNRDAFQYRFPYNLISEGKQIVLYGAGNVGEEYCRLLKLTNYCQIVLWADKNAEYYRKQGLQVSDMEEIKSCSYDYVLVAVYQKKTAEEIIQELKICGVDSEKIIWAKPQIL